MPDFENLFDKMVIFTQHCWTTINCIQFYLFVYYSKLERIRNIFRFFFIAECGTENVVFFYHTNAAVSMLKVSNARQLILSDGILNGGPGKR